MKRLVLFDESTGDTKGYVLLATDSDAQFYPGALEIPLDHPAPYDQANWHVGNGKLVRQNGKKE